MVPAASDIARLRRALEGSLGVPFSEGNGVERLLNGVEIFPALLEAIRSARHFIDLETFVYWSGDIAESVAEALVEAADRGVRVRVLLDAIGTLPMPASIKDRLAGSKAVVREFRPPARWRFWEVDHRTHRKILVCDGVAFTGGVGIADEWTGDARTADEWRESHFALQGPAVGHLRGVFLEHWLEAGERDPGVDASDIRASTSTLPETRPYRPELDGEGMVQVVRSGTGVGWSDVEMLLRALLVHAQRSLRITTAHFVPDDSLVELLVAAAERGVDVSILNPGPHTDHRISQLAGEDAYARLLEGGVKIFRYQPTMLHAKILTVDGVLSTIGSANFNHRSLLKDDEVCLNVLDRRLAARLEADFEHDLERAQPVDPSLEWARRSPMQRFGEWFGRRFRNQL